MSKPWMCVLEMWGGIATLGALVAGWSSLVNRFGAKGFFPILAILLGLMSCLVYWSCGQ